MPFKLNPLTGRFDYYEVASGTVPDGTTTGDILRWNASSGAWESTGQPFQFNQIVLVPAAVAPSDIEGGLWYKSTEKSVYVCTEGA